MLSMHRKQSGDQNKSQGKTAHLQTEQFLYSFSRRFDKWRDIRLSLKSVHFGM